MLLLLYAFSYLLGSIPFGKLFCLLDNVDIQKRGSGNIGFANVQRIMGWKFALPTLFFDITKGSLATFLGLQYGGIIIGFIAGVAAIIGHVYPVWLRFKGGKGIATGIGMVAVIMPFIALATLTTYAALLRLKVSSARASLIGVLIVSTGFMTLLPHYWWMGLICVGITLYTLRDNLTGTVPDYG